MKAETRTEKKVRLLLGCFWVGFVVMWWIGSVVPVIYVVANAP